MKPPAPPRVDPFDYWSWPTPEESGRCTWWRDRIRSGWRPNRRISAMGYDERAHHFGVYMWEMLHVLDPILDELSSTAPSFSC